MSNCLRLAVILCLLLTACGKAAAPTPLPSVHSTPTSTPIAVPTATPRPSGPLALATASYAGGTIRADAWVSDATPPLGSKIGIHGRLGGPGAHHFVMMYATWPENGTIVANVSQVIYLSGATIEVVGFTPGQFVPVTVTLVMDNVEYVVHTGFTPR